MRSLLFGLVFFSTSTYALVDYSEMTSAAPVRQNNNNPAPQVAPPAQPPAAQMVQREAPRTQGSGNHQSWFNMSAGYEALSFNGQESENKIQFTQLRASIHTNYDLFLQLAYWQAQSSSAELTESSRSQQGNPMALLGFHWLKFGAPHELGTVDVYGGASLKGSSDLASSRTDRLAGIETTKRFGDFLIGLGFDYRFSGNPKNGQEYAIGNVQRLSATLGWMATPDIQFLVEGTSARVMNALDSGAVNFLAENQSLGFVTTKLGLGLRSFVQLELGARFKTKEANDTNSLVGARLWDLSGGFGNSLFANLNLAI